MPCRSANMPCYKALLLIAAFIIISTSATIAGCSARTSAGYAAALETIGQIEVIDRYVSGEYVAVVESGEAKRIMDSGVGAIMLDVRPGAVYQARHISMAESAPFDMLADYAAENIPEKDRIIIYYCFCGRSDSSLAVPAYNALKELGYANVYYTEPGNEWDYEGTQPPGQLIDDQGRFLISGHQANERKNADNGVILLDVRNQDEYDMEHIDGSMLIPVFELPERLEELPDKGATIIVYCKFGSRSAAAYDILFENGFTSIYDMQSVFSWPEQLVGENVCGPCG